MGRGWGSEGEGGGSVARAWVRERCTGCRQGGRPQRARHSHVRLGILLLPLVQLAVHAILVLVEQARGATLVKGACGPPDRARVESSTPRPPRREGPGADAAAAAAAVGGSLPGLAPLSLPRRRHGARPAKENQRVRGCGARGALCASGPTAHRSPCCRQVQACWRGRM